MGLSIWLQFGDANKSQLKRIPPGVSYKAASRDPTVEFDISGKSVTDEGLRQISEALVLAIRYADPDRALILEEVCLKNNKFSAIGIVSFAPVINASVSELRNLDLSDNSIEVKTSEDAAAWEKFLRAFAHCSALRRLDLSGNKLGQKGFEILSKVWVTEDGIITCKQTGQAKICGLQSIPYISLANTGLDDIGSTYLSCILENHKYVDELLPLVPQPKLRAQLHQLEALDEVDGCDGLVWKPNREIGTHGLRVLELAEAVRKSRRDLQDQDAIFEPLQQAVDDLDLKDSRQSPIERRSREDSIVSLDESFHITSSNTTSELVRARSKIWLDLLKNGGLRQNDLWISAFKMLRYIRIILLASNLCQSHSSPIIIRRSSTTSTTVNSVLSTHTVSRAWPALPSMTPARRISHGKQRHFKSRPQVRAALAIGTPNISFSIKQPFKKDSPATEALLPKYEVAQSKPNDHDNFIELLSKCTKEQYTTLYKSNLPVGFPEHIWTDIIAYAVDAEGVLSENQKSSVVRWGASRDSIAELQSLRGKHDSQQVYKGLEGMGCLMYGI